MRILASYVVIYLAKTKFTYGNVGKRMPWIVVSLKCLVAKSNFILGC